MDAHQRPPHGDGIFRSLSFRTALDLSRAHYDWSNFWIAGKAAGFASRGVKPREHIRGSQDDVTRLTVTHRYQESDDGAASYMEYNAC